MLYTFLSHKMSLMSVIKPRKDALISTEKLGGKELNHHVGILCGSISLEHTLTCLISKPVSIS